MKMRKVTALLLVLAMLAACLAACGGTAPAQPAESSGEAAPASSSEAAPASSSEAAPASSEAPAETPAESTGGDMITLKCMEGSSDKLAACWFNTGTISWWALCSRLLTLDPDNNPSVDEDSLAADYSVSDDFMDYEFILKDGVKWHDGQDLTADDVKYSIEFACRYGSLNSVLIGAFSCIEGYDDLLAGSAQEMTGIKVDGNKVSIHLAKPTAFLVFSLGSFVILPKHELEKYDPLTFGTCDFWLNPIGSGPYKLKEFHPNDYAILEKNEDYYGNKAEIPYIKLAMINEGDYVTMAQAGEIDYVQTMDVATALEIQKLDNYTVQNVAIMYNDMFFWNSYGRGGNGDDPIADIRVRTAILHAIDRQAIVDSILYGYGLVHDTMVPASDPNYNNDTYKFTYDPAKAKALLDEAGFDYSRTLRIATYYDNQTTANILDTVVYYLGEVGVKAEWFVLTGDLVAGIYETRDYEMLYGDNSAIAPVELYGNMASTVGGYISKLFPTEKNPMDDLIAEYKTTGDLAKQGELMKQMQEKEAEMLYYMPLWTLDEFIISNNRINGTITYGNEWRNYDRGLQDWTLD